MKRTRCKHFWDLIDKWIDPEGTTHWEFFCKYCLKIQVKIRKNKKAHTEKIESK